MRCNSIFHWIALRTVHTRAIIRERTVFARQLVPVLHFIVTKPNNDTAIVSCNIVCHVGSTCRYIEKLRLNSSTTWLDIEGIFGLDI